MKMKMKMKTNSIIAIIVVGLLGLSGCSNSSESATKELSSMSALQASDEIPQSLAGLSAGSTDVVLGQVVDLQQSRKVTFVSGQSFEMWAVKVKVTGVLKGDLKVESTQYIELPLGDEESMSKLRSLILNRAVVVYASPVEPTDDSQFTATSILKFDNDNSLLKTPNGIGFIVEISEDESLVWPFEGTVSKGSLKDVLPGGALANKFWN
jgi:hypothetical protein